MLCHVNLIPLNKVKETGLETTTRKRAENFLAILKKRRIPATIRRELGDDIDGAAASCGLKSKTNDLKFFFSALSHLPLENIRSVLYNEKNNRQKVRQNLFRRRLPWLNY